jgi:hypothetical protein
MTASGNNLHQHAQNESAWEEEQQMGSSGALLDSEPAEILSERARTLRIFPASSISLPSSPACSPVSRGSEESD